MKKLTTYILTAFFIVSFANNLIGQNHLTKKYLVISISIKDSTLYRKCLLNKTMFDSTTCLTLTFDTITSDNQARHLESKLKIDLDTLKSPIDFKISFFAMEVNQLGGDISVGQKSNCFSKESLKEILKWTDDIEIAIEDITLIYNSGKSKINFPYLYFYIRH